MFIDTHAHLFKEYYDSINDCINDAKNSNINLIINSSVDKNTSIEVLNTLNNDCIYASIGIHPEYASMYNEEDIEFIKQNINNPKVLAIGEIGLDYHYENYDKENQIKLFEKQLQIAQDYNIPVIIHSREATQDTIDILNKYNVKGIIHSFSGSKEVANIYIKKGFLLGINGVITFKNCNLINTLKEIGIENIVLETDSPYLTPVPYRGKKNTPANVLEIAKFISQNLDISLEKLAKITNRNVYQIFDKLK